MKLLEAFEKAGEVDIAGDLPEQRVKTRPADAGEIDLKTGMLAFSDPFDRGGSIVFARTVPPGSYPVRVVIGERSRAEGEVDRPHIGGVKVVFKDGPITRWEKAAPPGRDPLLASATREFTHEEKSGGYALLDHAIVEGRKLRKPHRDTLAPQVSEAYDDREPGVCFVIGGSKFLVFNAKKLNGARFGLDAGGNPVCFVALLNDFGFELPKAAEDAAGREKYIASLLRRLEEGADGSEALTHLGEYPEAKERLAGPLLAWLHRADPGANDAVHLEELGAHLAKHPEGRASFLKQVKASASTPHVHARLLRVGIKAGLAAHMEPFALAALLPEAPVDAQKAAMEVLEALPTVSKDAAERIVTLIVSGPPELGDRALVCLHKLADLQNATSRAHVADAIAKGLRERPVPGLVRTLGGFAAGAPKWAKSLRPLLENEDNEVVATAVPSLVALPEHRKAAIAAWARILTNERVAAAVRTRNEEMFDKDLVNDPVMLEALQKAAASKAPTVQYFAQRMLDKFGPLEERHQRHK